METDELIAAAILGEIDRDSAARQIGVKMAVQRKIFCPECDQILDQNSAELWHNADTGRALTILCPDCSANWKTKVQEMHAAHHRTHGPQGCLLYTSPSPRDLSTSRMPSSA